MEPTSWPVWTSWSSSTWGRKKPATGADMISSMLPSPTRCWGGVTAAGSPASMFRWCMTLRTPWMKQSTSSGRARPAPAASV